MSFNFLTVNKDRFQKQNYWIKKQGLFKSYPQIVCHNGYPQPPKGNYTAAIKHLHRKKHIHVHTYLLSWELRKAFLTHLIWSLPRGGPINVYVAS